MLRRDVLERIISVNLKTTRGALFFSCRKDWINDQLTSRQQEQICCDIFRWKWNTGIQTKQYAESLYYQSIAQRVKGSWDWNCFTFGPNPSPCQFRYSFRQLAAMHISTKWIHFIISHPINSADISDNWRRDRNTSQQDKFTSTSPSSKTNAHFLKMDTFDANKHWKN